MLVPRTVFHLHAIADDNASRYALGGVHFRRSADGMPIAVAADGHCLMVSTWREDSAAEYPTIAGCNPAPNGGTFHAIIPIAACKRAPMLAKGSRKPILARNIALDEHPAQIRKDGSAERVSLGATDAENGEVLDVATLAGKYPRYPDGFPDNAEAKTIRLSVDLLESMFTTCRKMGVEHIVLAVVDHKTAVTITGTSEDGISVAGAIMPRNPDKPSNPNPAPLLGWVPTN